MVLSYPIFWLLALSTALGLFEEDCISVQHPVSHFIIFLYFGILISFEVCLFKKRLQRRNIYQIEDVKCKMIKNILLREEFEWAMKMVKQYLAYYDVYLHLCLLPILSSANKPLFAAALIILLITLAPRIFAYAYLYLLRLRKSIQNLLLLLMISRLLEMNALSHLINALDYTQNIPPRKRILITLWKVFSEDLCFFIILIIYVNNIQDYCDGSLTYMVPLSISISLLLSLISLIPLMKIWNANKFIEYAFTIPQQQLNFSNTNLGNDGIKKVMLYLQNNIITTNIQLAHNECGTEGIESIADFLTTNFTLFELNLFGNKIEDIGAGILAKSLEKNHTLKYLDLRSNQITEIGGSEFLNCLFINWAITNLLLENNHCSKLLDKVKLGCLANSMISENNGEFKISSQAINVEDSKFLAQKLQNNEHIISLVLNDTELGDDGLKPLAEMLEENGAITTLNIASNQITDIGVRYLADTLILNNKLAILNLGSNSISTEGVQTIIQAINQNKTLHELILSKNNLQQETGNLLYNLLIENETISYLNLEQNDITSETITKIKVACEINAKLLENKSEIKLSSKKYGLMIGYVLRKKLVNNNEVRRVVLTGGCGNQGAAQIGNLIRKNAVIETIELWRNGIGNVGAIALAEAVKINTSIKSIDLEDNEIGREGGEAIAQALIENNFVTGVYLESNYIKDGLLARIRASCIINKEMSKRQNGLKLDGLNLSDKGAQIVCQKLKYNQLILKVKMRNNSIGNEGAKAFGELLKGNSTILSLCLGDKGGIFLAEALQVNFKLHHLDLSGNPITKKGAEVLGETMLKSIQNLTINLERTNQFDDGVLLQFFDVDSELSEGKSGIFMESVIQKDKI